MDSVYALDVQCQGSDFSEVIMNVALSRREYLAKSANGFGMLALAALLAENSPALPLPAIEGGEGKTQSGPHHRAKIKNVIFLFMDGGPSQVDTFDPKPLLKKEHGKPFPTSIDATQFDQNGSTFASPFRFYPRGRSGLMISELFPHLSKHADELCLIRSMKGEFAEHSQACMFLHSGHPLQGRPSLGSWVGYGLGSDNRDLPGFVIVNGGMLPIGGPENFSNTFLPADFQGTFLDAFSGAETVQNVTPARSNLVQSRMIDFIRASDDVFVKQRSDIEKMSDSGIDAAIRNYETASAMQLAVPELADLSSESEATHRLYGTDSKDPLLAQYARQCLLARRLVERGVRFVELTCVKGIRFIAPWDDHENIDTGHRKNAYVVDQPIAALIEDLKARGLFESTLLVFAGEFGRTPFAQRSQGRDHNPQGFTIWLAGGGVRGGYAHGATDEFGYRAVENVVTMHDLHATILYLLGLDHERLTFRWGGRDFRLTDVYGNVVRECLTG